MTTGRRIALLAIVAVIAVVGFIILKPDDDKNDTASSDQTAQSAPQGGAAGTTAAEPAPPQVIQIDVKDGKPVGGIREIDADKGDRVRFAVNSDVADEIHVHGYDFMKDVEAGGKVGFSFPAKIDGEFVVELEDREEQIAKLVVNP